MSVPMRTTPFGFLGVPPFLNFLRPGRMASARPNAARAAPRKIAGSFPKPLPPPPRDAQGRDLDLDKLLARARVAPALALIDWEGDRPPAPAATAPAGTDALPANDDEDPRVLDPKRRKIRDRYIGARFPGVARSAADLEAVDRMIKAARLYFEDEQPHTALELLQLAIEESPHESALALAQLEFLFLLRDGVRFVAQARAFRAAHEGHEAWEEIARLGRALVPAEPLFGGEQGPRDHEHYGPWPHLPNWIRAPWDLTGEIAAADFHRALARTAPVPDARDAD